MKYYSIKLFQGEEILVTPVQADQIKQQIQQGAKFVQPKNQLVQVGNIATIEESDKEISPYLELAGEVTKQKPPILPGNRVQAIWVKKRVTDREYDKRYANLPGYHRLPGAELYVAFTRILGDALPAGLEEVTQSEFSYLEGRVN